MKYQRQAGILAHISSLPGSFGIGDFGESSRKFIDFLSAAKQSLWQILPLGPVGFGNSPYAPLSAFAIDPIYIDCLQLVADQWVTSDDVSEFYLSTLPDDRASWGPARDAKDAVLRRAFERFVVGSNVEATSSFKKFCAQEEEWLTPVALFLSIKKNNDGQAWTEWGDEFRQYSTTTAKKMQKTFAVEIQFQQWAQWIANTQWLALRAYANENGIHIIGDIPFYSAMDSCDVWTEPGLYKLDKKLNATHVGGVPPDYFSPLGQKWGMPVYDWAAMKKEKYDWWKKRLSRAAQLFDAIRLDHFRGFVQFYQVPAKEENAKNGEWIDGPAGGLLKELQSELSKFSLVIAEDLGIITQDVEKLRDELGLPGMKILQFGLESCDTTNTYLTHNYETTNSVVYTGTHDNDTTLSWLRSRPKRQDRFINRIVGKDEPQVQVLEMIRYAYSSVARIAIIPIHDILILGSSSRMNTPGTVVGNWETRFDQSMLAEGIADTLSNFMRLFNRTTK